MRPCTRCNGTKTISSPGYVMVQGEEYPAPVKLSQCPSCEGQGTYPEINESKIRERIMATRGKNKGKLRASMTSCFSDRDEARAYYVWRLARFHGGKDMTMPMMADLALRGDPFKKELDALADAVAKEAFGTDLAAAYRWGRAFYG